MRAIQRALILVLAILACQAAPVMALDLKLPEQAKLAREVIREADTLFLPTGPFDKGTLPRLKLEGRITERVWQFPAQNLTTLQILLPLRAAIEQSGWEVIYECGAQECGGFDFRFNIPLLPAPEMVVDLFDFRFLAARQGRPGPKAQYAFLFVSQPGGSGYLQLSHIEPHAPVSIPPHALEAQGDEGIEAADGPSDAQDADTLAKSLLDEGHVALAGLDFASGAAALGPGPYESLQALANFLKSDPARRVVLVGHTDATSNLDANIALSRARAQAVIERLIVAHGVEPGQLEAEGVGYLAPHATNRTPEGREQNRRVEAVLLTGE